MLTHVTLRITMGDDMLARLFKTVPNGLVEVHCTSALFVGSADMFYATCHQEDFKWILSISQGRMIFIGRWRFLKINKFDKLAYHIVI